MYTQQFFVEGLGCASYLVGCEVEGVAAVVDPDRRVKPYLEAARVHGLRITHILETHLHADHVSGDTTLAERTGAPIYLPAGAEAEFPHEALNAGDRLELGTVRLEVRPTPGHTPESVTLLATDTTRSEDPWLALTGDTLLVGDVGRPDLVGFDDEERLAGQLYDSLFGGLLGMDDGLLIYPAHGAGSLCGKSLGMMRSSSLGYERRHNPALAERPREDFIRFAIAELPEQPGNHHYIKQLNRQGPPILEAVTPKALGVNTAFAQLQRGAALLDTRPRAKYLARHAPGAVHDELDDQFSNRIGFILPAETRLVLLLEEPGDYEAAVYGLARVGYEAVTGYLEGGLNAWESQGLRLTGGDVDDIDTEALKARLQAENSPMVLDVREPWEYEQGHVPGARLIPLGDLIQRTGELDPDQPTAVICAAGNRSQTAAALLSHKKFSRVYSVTDGTDGWKARGYPLE